ncbi:MAG: hypothetical protein ACI4JM_03305 [Oscillospiraceae bacterium]
MMKRIFVLCAVCVFSAVLSGCGGIANSNKSISETSAIETTRVTEAVETEITSVQTEEITEAETTENTGKYSSIIKRYREENLEDYMKNVEWTEDIVFDDKEALKEYVQECAENHMTDVYFIFAGNQPLQTEEIADSSHVEVYGSLLKQAILESEEACAVYGVIQMNYFPSVYVIDAFSKNDTSSLDGDNLALYNKASEFINTELDDSMTDAEKEWKIHKYICDTADYYTEERNDSNPDEFMYYIPRFRTAVGALLDGRSNCMGYTDAFYMLASMAGIEVTKVSGDDAMNHAWNVITLDGKKYLVDVTWNDGQLSEGEDNYTYYNASRDIASEEYHVDYSNENSVKAMEQLVASPDENYFYNNTENHGYITYSYDEFYNKLAELIQNGEKLIYICCQNNSVAGSNQDIFNNLSQRTNLAGISMNIAYQNISGYSFAYIEIV